MESPQLSITAKPQVALCYFRPPVCSGTVDDREHDTVANDRSDDSVNLNIIPHIARWRFLDLLCVYRRSSVLRTSSARALSSNGGQLGTCDCPRITPSGMLLRVQSEFFQRDPNPRCCRGNDVGAIRPFCLQSVISVTSRQSDGVGQIMSFRKAASQSSSRKPAFHDASDNSPAGYYHA